MASFKSYFIGFVISLALTLGAYFAVVNHWPYALITILLLAIAQLFVQMIFFLHLNRGHDRIWNLAAFFSAFGIIFILVVGSLWIMGHLNYNMMPEEIEERIIKDEGLHAGHTQNDPGKLPSDVLPEQLGHQYTAGGSLYVLVLEPNFNFYAPELWGKHIKWHGILKSSDNGKTWDKFFTVTNPINPKQNSVISYNPVGIFFENGNLFVDIYNTNGGGSGEGEMLRFSSSDEGKTWKRGSCYYFIPEEYNLTPEGNPTPIRPHNLKQITGCIY